MKNINRTSGQSIAEVIVALAIFTLGVAAVGSMMLDAERTTRARQERERASLLASEGIEAARSIRDGNFDALVSGTYGLVQNNGHFELSGVLDDEDELKREIEVVDIDANTKQVSSTVSWGENEGEDSVETVTILTRHK